MSSVERPLTVLVVDDHQDTVRMAALVLSRAGHSTKTASSCSEALAIARGEKIDVLITDLGLSDGDGYELLKKVRMMYPVRAIILTGTRREDAEQGDGIGVDAYLVKPIDLLTLEATVTSFA